MIQRKQRFQILQNDFYMGSKFPYCNSYFISKLRQISFNLGNRYTTCVTLP